MFVFNEGIEVDGLKCVFQAMADLDALVLAASGNMAGGRQSEVRNILHWLDALVIVMLLMVVHYFC